VSDGVLGFIGIAAILLPSLIASVLVYRAVKAWESRDLGAKRMMLQCCVAASGAATLTVGMIMWILPASLLTRVLFVTAAGALAGCLQAGQLLFIQDPRHWGGRLRRELSP